MYTISKYKFANYEHKIFRIEKKNKNENIFSFCSHLIEFLHYL